MEEPKTYTQEQVDAIRKQAVSEEMSARARKAGLKNKAKGSEYFRKIALKGVATRKKRKENGGKY